MLLAILSFFVPHDFPLEVSVASTVSWHLLAARNSFSHSLSAPLGNHVEIVAPPNVLLLLWELRWACYGMRC